jgi:hypothetical protein
VRGPEGWCINLLRSWKAISVIPDLIPNSREHLVSIVLHHAGLMSHKCHATLRKPRHKGAFRTKRGYLFASAFAIAADQPDKAAVKQATATCRAEVKEHAKYNEMSLWAQHKAVKKCVAEALAKH